MNRSKISLFVPGRLCLFGEHSDWAGMYRSINAEILPGEAIVTGIEQGIYAEAEAADEFEVVSELPLYSNAAFSSPMDTDKLLETAHSGGFFSYVAGVAAYINENYNVGGLRINITKMDLPIKSGLSSSAAICVLTARAFNRIYNLRMNTNGEMLAAYRGEQKTPSRCGRLDQACAYGVKPVLMRFDGDDFFSHELSVGGTMHWVVANLMASKDTIRILGDLNRCYPFAQTDTDRGVQEALGKDNRAFVSEARSYLENGDAENLGRLMTRWQENFDAKVMPASDELRGPVLHRVLSDEKIKALTFGGKGVGSQGDGSVQFLAKDESCAEELQKYLEKEHSMPSFRLTLHPGQSVKKAIIPLAGFGTRVFPATKCVKKCFLPIMDRDGVLKPALLIMLEQLIDAGIEEICLVIGEDEQADFDSFFARMPSDVYDKLPEDKKNIQREILGISEHVTYVHQKERLGFGHAVWLCREFTDGEPVLLLLGDFLYRSNNEINCCTQIMNAFMKSGMTTVSIMGIPLEKVKHYGILGGVWEDADERTMRVTRMEEKPTALYAEEHLAVSDRRGNKKYYATFGQYVLTAEVFEELEKMVCRGKAADEEYQLTSALESLCNMNRLVAFRPDGKSFDIGIPEAYQEAFLNFGK